MALLSTKLSQTTSNVIFSTSTIARAVTCIYLCNLTGSTVYANVYAAPTGSVVSDCPIYKMVEIAAEDTFIADTERLILQDGDSIWADCSVNQGIAMTLSSVII